MRLQDNQSKGKKYIIDQDFSNPDNELSIIDDIKDSINEKLNSPEARMLYSVLYDEKYGMYTNTETDDLIGPSLYREEEDFDPFNSYRILIKLYHEKDIKKFYNLSITEFINLSRYDRTILVEEAEEQMKIISERLESLKEDASDISTLDNLENELGF